VRGRSNQNPSSQTYEVGDQFRQRGGLAGPGRAPEHGQFALNRLLHRFPLGVVEGALEHYGRRWSASGRHFSKSAQGCLGKRHGLQGVCHSVVKKPGHKDQTVSAFGEPQGGFAAHDQLLSIDLHHHDRHLEARWLAQVALHPGRQAVAGPGHTERIKVSVPLTHLCQSGSVLQGNFVRGRVTAQRGLLRFQPSAKTRHEPLVQGVRGRSGRSPLARSGSCSSLRNTCRRYASSLLS
jgi:hypothetical protein